MVLGWTTMVQTCQKGSASSWASTTRWVFKTLVPISRLTRSSKIYKTNLMKSIQIALFDLIVLSRQSFTMRPQWWEASPLRTSHPLLRTSHPLLFFTHFPSTIILSHFPSTIILYALPIHYYSLRTPHPLLFFTHFPSTIILITTYGRGVHEPTVQHSLPLLFLLWGILLKYEWLK